MPKLERILATTGTAYKCNCAPEPISLDSALPLQSSLWYLPSQLAAASIYLARDFVGLNPWSPTLLQETLYCAESVAPVAEAIFLDQACVTPQSVRNKYDHDECCRQFHKDSNN